MSSPLRRPELPELPLRGYRFERLMEAFFAAGPALMEGGFVGVIADKLFHVHPAVLALITAAPMFGNLSSSWWARLAHGRPRVPLATALLGGFSLCVAGVALIPEGAAGAALLVALQIVSRQLLGGFIALRSIVWSLNYPREARGRVIAPPRRPAAPARTPTRRAPRRARRSRRPAGSSAGAAGRRGGAPRAGE